MATSCTTLVRNALKAIADGDATLRALTGRTSNILVRWKTPLEAPKPVLACLVAHNGRTGGTGDRRRVQVLVAAFAEGTFAQATAEAMTQRLREIVTPPALQARGLDGEVIEAVDRDGVDDSTDAKSPTAVGRSDLDLLIRVTAPQ